MFWVYRFDSIFIFISLHGRVFTDNTIINKNFHLDTNMTCCYSANTHIPYFSFMYVLMLMHELCNIVGNKSGYKICTCTEGISYYSVRSLVMLCKAIYGESIEGWGCLAATDLINSLNIHNKLNSFWMKGKAIRYNDHHLYFKTLSHFSSSVNMLEPSNNHRRLLKI